MYIDRLIELSADFFDITVENVQISPKLSLYRREKISSLESTVYQPLICLILQGSKQTSIGLERADLQAGDALLVSHDLPVVSSITKATAQEPYLALILSLNLNDVRSLYAQVANGQEPDAKARPLSYGSADATWLAPLVRYVELMANPRDAKVLGPSVLREIHYRLLLSPIGMMLRSLLSTDSHASRIGTAIEELRATFRSSVSVSNLANCAGMSVSSFHKHFKSVTGFTPLQYQKDLRLIEARALLVEQGATVSEAAYAVGYESPTHFSRDYSRKFGLAPSRDRLGYAKMGKYRADQKVGNMYKRLKMTCG